MLAWTIYISFIGVLVLMLLPREAARAARIIALLTAIAGCVVAFAGAVQQPNPGEVTTIVKVPGIPSLGANYVLAADGISLVLVVLTGLAAIAGILEIAWLNSGAPSFGADLGLDSIAAAVIGGASLAGGYGNVVASLVGALMVTIVQNVPSTPTVTVVRSVTPSSRTVADEPGMSPWAQTWMSPPGFHMPSSS